MTALSLTGLPGVWAEPSEHAAHHHLMSSVLVQRGFVPLYPQLTRACGSIKASLMLGQAIGLSRTWLRKAPEREGWFYMSAAEWTASVGLTQREQNSARGLLLQTGLWEERRTYNPSRLHFRVHLESLVQAMAGNNLAGASNPDTWIWTDSTAAECLGNAQMFFKPLADLVGDVMAGLLLSQLLALQRQALRDHQADLRGAFPVSYDQAAEELLMGSKMVRNARQRLREAGMIVEQQRGAGPSARIFVSLNLLGMMACLQVQPTGAVARRIAAKSAGAAPVPSAPVVVAQAAEWLPGAGATQRVFVDFTATQMPLLDSAHAQPGPDSCFFSSARGHSEPIRNKGSANQPVDNVAALLSIETKSWCPFVDSDGALLSSSIQRTITEIKEPPPVLRTAVDNSAAERRRRFPEEATQTRDLIFPTGIDPIEALRLVSRAHPEEQQAILDEFAGHLKTKEIPKPQAYLWRLVEKALKGELILTAASTVAAERQSRREAKLKAASVPEQVVMPAVRSETNRQRLLKARAEAAKHALIPSAYGSTGLLEKHS